ncbi:uncharacterized protein LOC112494802 [Cephus cinctus]|uniref:Uncharacterized protein LOC112494802 n=1 Tax=Cephus cinctus TaxID=211228 RepID=A0AAJ7RNJ0_CEPCN|nr:uncharacterized protein LOC112494802 [Cephus cinctus]
MDYQSLATPQESQPQGANDDRLPWTPSPPSRPNLCALLPITFVHTTGPHISHGPNHFGAFYQLDIPTRLHLRGLLATGCVHDEDKMAVHYKRPKLKEIKS